MQKILILVLTLLILVCPVLADEQSDELAGQNLEQVLADYMAANNLHEGNFSFSYYNTVTGEAHAFNDKAFMVAASTYKLPLNMYYYEMERDGEIASDAFIPSAGVTLDVAHRESLVNSNNDFSIGLLYNLGNFQTYKTIMKDTYFTIPEEEIDPVYYANNHYCVHMMMDALKYLYEHSDDFEEMLGYMKQAQPEEYFRAGVTGYEVAHKYGWYDGAVNDVGIIYTEEPFLLAVYTKDIYGEAIVAGVADLMTRYNVANLTPPEPEPVEEQEETVTLEIEMVPVEQPAEEPAEPEQEPVIVEPEEEVIVPETEEPEPEAPPAPEPTEEKSFEWWMVGVALLVFLLGGGGTLLVFQNKHLKKMKLEEESEDD